jgi:sarcosine oxidase
MATNQSATINTSFDVIVIGVGSMGSSACFFLAQRGYKVLGLEQFDIPHEQGSHGGQSRIIRKAYFEHPDYVPLLNKAYENWKNFEAETGTQIYYPTGLVYFGKPDSTIIKGVKQSASLYNIPLENLSYSAASKRFPQFMIPEDFETLFETGAGFIQPHKAITLYKDSAIKKGAEIHTKEKVRKTHPGFCR